MITVKVPVVKYIFVTLALACSICIYPIVWPERIRAARGTSAAGMAIGITNVSVYLYCAIRKKGADRCVTRLLHNCKVSSGLRCISPSSDRRTR